MKCARCGKPLGLNDTISGDPETGEVRHLKMGDCFPERMEPLGPLPAMQVRHALVGIAGFCCIGRVSVLLNFPFRTEWEPKFLCPKCGQSVDAVSVEVVDVRNV